MSNSPAAYGTGDSALERVNAMIRFYAPAQALGVEVTKSGKGAAWGRVPYRGLNWSAIPRLASSPGEC